MKLTLQGLEKLFPFCLILDEKGQCQHIGKSLQKIIGTGLLHENISQEFRFLRPEGAQFSQLIKGQNPETIVIKVLNKNIDLMGEILTLENGNQYFLALNLVVQDVSQISDLGLVFSDFANHDPVFDFMMLLQTQKRAIKHSEELNRKLTEAHEIALKASATKSQFLANMSHELRTPMNGVIGMASVLQDTNLTAEQKEYVDAIMSSGESMVSLVNDILDLTKIEAGHHSMDLQTTNLKSVIQNAISSVAVIAEKKNLPIEFHFDDQLSQAVLTDPLRIRQVALNYISNAIKFTDSGQVSVRLSRVSESATEVEIKFSVEDTGIGMEADLVREIFRPFVQGDSSLSKKYSGTGLGLSICKKLIESMGGTVGVHSQVGKGSQFWFQLSFKKSGPSPAI